MKIKLTQFLLLLLIVFNPIFVISQGLGFYSSYDVNIEKRTAYTVFADQVPTIHDEMTISFELSIQSPLQFGYICTIDIDNTKDIYSLSYVSFNGDTYLKLNREGETNLITVPIKLSEWGKGRWNRISLKFNLDENIARLFINNKEFHCQLKSLNKSIQANIFFGKHGNIIDVPDFAIRNLAVKGIKKSFHFSFKEDDGSMVHDQRGKTIGYVENPKWLINDSYHWKHRYTKMCNTISAVRYDNYSNRIIIAGKDSVTFVNMLDYSVSENAYLNENPVSINLGMTCMNNNHLLLYELTSNSPGFATIATLKLDSLVWKINSYKMLENERHHHNSYFSPEQQQLYIFGGYGDKKFYNSLHRYNLLSDTWELPGLSGDKILPRFFSGMTNADNHLILFGGVGNSTGDQSVGKKYFYDCYSINLENYQVKKLWEIDRGDTKLVSSRGLVISPDSTSFYSICYPEYVPNTYLKLHKYKLSNGEYTVLGDSIPMVSEEIKTNVNLYANKKTKELYCVIQQFTNEDSGIIKVYSINYPPISLHMLKNDEYNTKINTKSWVWILAAISAAFLFFLLSIIKRRKKVGQTRSYENKLHEGTTKMRDPSKNAIYLFGHFTVFNHLGNEISYQFSPLMKELFLFILYKSSEDGEGVTSEQIYDTIWPDKQLKNAKNIKGVTINKIRNTLTDINGIELIYENKIYMIKTEAPLYYDYLSFTTLLKNLTFSIGEMNSKELYDIISRGPFLKSKEMDFLDFFKSEVSNKIINIAPHILNYYYRQKKFTACISFAKSLYHTDELYKSAFYFIIQANLALGRISEAKRHYTKYTIKYQEIQDQDYDLMFADVVKASTIYLKNIRTLKTT